MRSSKNAISPHGLYDDPSKSPFNRVTKSGAKYTHTCQSAEKHEENSNVKIVSEVAKLQQANVHYPTSASKDPKSTGAVNQGGSTQISAFKPVVKDGVSPFRTNRSSSFGPTFQSHGKATSGTGMNNAGGSSYNVHNVSTTNIGSGSGQQSLAQSATKASSQNRAAGNFFTSLQSFNRS